MVREVSRRTRRDATRRDTTRRDTTRHETAWLTRGAAAPALRRSWCISGGRRSGGRPKPAPGPGQCACGCRYWAGPAGPGSGAGLARGWPRAAMQRRAASCPVRCQRRAARGRSAARAPHTRHMLSLHAGRSPRLPHGTSSCLQVLVQQSCSRLLDWRRAPSPVPAGQAGPHGARHATMRQLPGHVASVSPSPQFLASPCLSHPILRLPHPVAALAPAPRTPPSPPCCQSSCPPRRRAVHRHSLCGPSASLPHSPCPRPGATARASRLPSQRDLLSPRLAQLPWKGDLLPPHHRRPIRPGLLWGLDDRRECRYSCAPMCFTSSCPSSRLRGHCQSPCDGHADWPSCACSQVLPCPRQAGTTLPLRA